MSHDRVFLAWNDLSSEDLKLFERKGTIEEKRFLFFVVLLHDFLHLNFPNRFRSFLHKVLDLEGRYLLAGNTFKSTVRFGGSWFLS